MKNKAVQDFFTAHNYLQHNRVLYYYDNNTIVILISLFKKAEKQNITDKEKIELKKLLPLLLEEYRNE